MDALGRKAIDAIEKDHMSHVEEFNEFIKLKGWLETKTKQLNGFGEQYARVIPQLMLSQRRSFVFIFNTAKTGHVGQDGESTGGLASRSGAMSA